MRDNGTLQFATSCEKHEKTLVQKAGMVLDHVDFGFRHEF